MKLKLAWKIIAGNAVVLAVAIAIVWWAVDTLAADYFMALMKKYEINPKDVHNMFLEATHRALLWATLGGLILALGLNYFLIRRALEPLSQMARVTAKVAAGDYSARAAVKSHDEISALGRSFNEMAQSLERIETLRNTMVIGVAHELRTPLTNLRGYLEALRDGVIEPDKAAILTLEEETNRLIVLAEDVLELARSGAFPSKFRPQPINLATIVRETARMMLPRFRDKKQTLKASLNAADRQIAGDPKKLMLVIQNMLENALLYTPRGGRIRLRSAIQDSCLKFVVSNEGEGIASRDLPYIFEDFYRGEKSRSRAHGGAGIGLAVVKQLIKLHGGTVGAESNKQETHVWFTLPLAES